MFNQRMSRQMYAPQTISPLQPTQPTGVPNEAQPNYMQLIQSGDSTAGEKAAYDILKKVGLSKDEAIAQAKAFFGIK